MVLKETRRFLQSSPLLSVSAVAVFALGIGASALALALLLAFSSLSYPGMRSQAYATISEETSGGGSMPIAWQRFAKLAAAVKQGPLLAAYSKPFSATLEIDGRNKRLRFAAVSTNFFSRFTGALSAGRDFDKIEEEQPDARVAILSLPLAVRLFRSPEAALNRFVRIQGSAYQVVGVAHAGFSGMFGVSADAWVPAHCVIPLMLSVPPGVPAPQNIWKRIAVFYGVAGSTRISSGALAAKMARSLPLHAAGQATMHVSQGLTTDPNRDARARKWLRLGLLLALVFTLVSSLNYALLLLARTPRYVEEVRLKRALGAGSGRLAAELVIGPAATVATSLIAATVFWAGGLALVSRMSPFYKQLVRGSWHAALLAFSIQVPFACALTIGIALIPTLGLLRESGSPRLGYTSTASRGTGALHQVLVTLQIAFCLGTWILAGMTVAAVLSVIHEPLGYQPSRLTVVCIGPSHGGVSFEVSPRRSFPPISAVQSLLNRVNALPGVRAATFAAAAPFDLPPDTVTIRKAGDAAETPRTVNQMLVSSGYFRVMGTRMIRGAGFSSYGIAGDDKEVVVNQALAKEVWSGVNPVGRSVDLIFPARFGMPSSTQTATVVGVAEDMRFSGFLESPEPTVFQPLGSEFALPMPYLLVQGSESIHSLERVASAQVSAQMPGLSVLRSYSAGERASASAWKIERRAWFAMGGALLMALVAYLGLYGALAYYVNTRRREMAVRICLGALPWTIRKLVMVRALRCAVLAAIISAPLWPALSHLSSSEYLGQASWSTDRAILLSLACVLVAMLISLIPAAAATRVLPADVLKNE